MEAKRDSDRMWWPWRLFFGLFIAAGLAIAGFGVLLLGKAEGPYAGVALFLALVAELVIAAVAGVNWVLYRAGRDRPLLRKTHGWVALAAIVLVATAGLRAAYEPPGPPVDWHDFARLLDQCKIVDVQEIQTPMGGRSLVTLKDGTTVITQLVTMYDWEQNQDHCRSRS